MMRVKINNFNFNTVWYSDESGIRVSGFQMVTVPDKSGICVVEISLVCKCSSLDLNTRHFNPNLSMGGLIMCPEMILEHPNYGSVFRWHFQMNLLQYWNLFKLYSQDLNIKHVNNINTEWQCFTCSVFRCPVIVSYSGHGLNNKLLVWYSSHQSRNLWPECHTFSSLFKPWPE